MAENNETVADIVREIRDRNPRIRFPAEYGGGEATNEMYQLADRIETAHRREVEELQRRIEKQKEISKELVDENDALRAKLKVAEDALTDLQSRLVASVYDGSMNPHEALKVAEDALAAIREKGADHE